MSRGYLQKTKTRTKITGWEIQEDGTPKQAAYIIDGRVGLNKALHTVRKKHPNFMAVESGIEYEDQMYVLGLEEFWKHAVTLEEWEQGKEGK